MIKPFLAFIKKEFYHILRDRRTLLILFGLPVIQVLLFGYAISMEFKNASFGVLDYSKSQAAHQLVEKIDATEYFTFKRHFKNPEDIHRAFRRGAIKLAIVIPAGFEENLNLHDRPAIQIIADGAEPNVANALVSYLKRIALAFQSQYFNYTGPATAIDISVRMIYNPSLKSVFMFVPGVMAFILMLVSALMTALTIAKEKETGTMELLLVSPLPPALIIIGKVVPYVLLAFINAVLILLVGVYVFGVPVVGSLLLLLMLCGLFILTALSIGIFISIKSKTQQAAMMVSLMLLMMPTMLLSGFVFPLESMPEVLQYIAHIIPAKYFIEILKNIMLKGTGFLYVWQESLALFVITGIFLIAGIAQFKARLE